ncbi:MAG TPA: tetratricopeptide repeat protein, partial [Deltaproteobacteria bacterium]|nr:tetratricopeptide repeat protein [Deltaproteobacteria bacterium]
EPVFHYHLGLVLYQEKNPKGAEAEFKEAIRLGLDKKELTTAKELLAKMKDPDHLQEGMIQDMDKAIENKDFSLALTFAKKARQRMPEDPDIADKLGFIYLEMDSLLLAKNNLEEAVKMMPGNPVFRYHLGLALYLGKDFSGARNEFQKAIKMGLDTDKAAEARDLLRKSQEKEG